MEGYLVHYKNWNSRFDQWVAPDRVVEPSKVNLEVQVSQIIPFDTVEYVYLPPKLKLSHPLIVEQDEVLQDFSTANNVAPPLLEGLFAYKFLNAKKRARTTPASKAEIFESSFTRTSASHDEKLLGLLKGATLLIESALPRGSVGYSGYGSWDNQAAALWRNFARCKPCLPALAGGDAQRVSPKFSRFQ